MLWIILIDDGSDDRCPQICDYHAQADNRVKAIYKENGGMDSAISYSKRGIWV